MALTALRRGEGRGNSAEIWLEIKECLPTTFPGGVTQLSQRNSRGSDSGFRDSFRSIKEGDAGLRFGVTPMSGEMVYCTEHGPSSWCYIQADGSHMDIKRCRCQWVPAPDCPVDAHRQEAKSHLAVRT